MAFDSAQLAETLLGLSSDLPDDAPVALSVGDIRKTLGESYAGMEKQALLFRQLMDALPDFVYFKDENSRFIYNNIAHTKDLGYEHPDEVYGKTDFDFFQHTFAEAKYQDEQEILRTGEGWEPRMEHHVKSNGDERWVYSTKHPWRDENGVVCGTFGLSRDITAQRKAEIALAEKHQLLTTLVDALPCRIYVRDRQHRFKLINTAYLRSLKLENDTNLIGLRLDEVFQDDRVNRILYEDEQVMRTDQAIYQQIEYDRSPVESERWLSISKVPLKNEKGETNGIVGASFDITTQKEAEARARSASAKLKEKNVQMEAELAVARKIQRTLATVRLNSLLRESTDRKLLASYWYEPCEHLAGDFFHILPIDEHRFGLFICDVMGHGVKSALVTVVLRGLLEEKRNDLTDPASLFDRINRVIHSFAEDPDFPRFVTAAYALFDRQAHTLESVYAGHLPILHVNPETKEKEEIPLPHAQDPALGIVENYEYRSKKIPIPEGSTFVFVTDGLIEQISPEGIEFGWDSLQTCLLDNKGEVPDNLLREVRQRLENHTGKPQFDDDVCVVAVNIK